MTGKGYSAPPVIPSRSTGTKKAYCPKRFYRKQPSANS
jgi:hypothetical protein